MAAGESEAKKVVNGTPRSRLRKVTTQGEKRRILRRVDDDVLVGFLIESCQDAIDHNIKSYPNEDEDIKELIAEILIRMDAAKTLELKNDKV